MPFPNDELTLSTKITVAEAEDLAGVTLHDWDVGNKKSLSQEIPRPWANFSFGQPDDYGFFKADKPGDADIEGHAAGKPGFVPLILVLAMSNTRCFERQSSLSTLFLAKRMFRWHAAISLEGGLPRRAAWHEDVDVKAMTPVARHLWEVREQCRSLAEELGLNGYSLPIDSTLDYALQAAYPHAGSTVLCCSRDVANYWGQGVFPAVAAAAREVIGDMLGRCIQLAEAKGVQVISGKWLALPGYEPLFDTEDVGNF